MKTNYTNQEIVNITHDILKENHSKWNEVYQNYAHQLKEKEERFFYRGNASKFRVPNTLDVYTTLTKAKNKTTTCCYDLRFAGCSIAEISIKKNGDRKMSVNMKKAKLAKETFKFDKAKVISCKKENWNDKDCSDFRAHFKKLTSNEALNLSTKEHRIENFLLKEFAKPTKKEKLLPNIQPIHLGDKNKRKLFFQFSTPLSGSNHVPEFCLDETNMGATGGGIDILARVTHQKGEKPNHRIAIIEIKDENKESENQKLVMQQALIYATFIAHLLRSDSGDEWWGFFGKKRNTVDDELHLDVVSLMPKGNSTEGELDDIEIKELKTTLHLYTLYYEKDKDGNPSSFTGTLTEHLQK